MIRRLGVEYNDSGQTGLTAKVGYVSFEHFIIIHNYQALALLWDLARDRDLPVGAMDQALNSHYKILESLRRDQHRSQYITKCIDELKDDTGLLLITFCNIYSTVYLDYVVPAIKHMQRLFLLSADAPTTMSGGSQRTNQR